jgi:hypothetical protein
MAILSVVDRWGAPLETVDSASDEKALRHISSIEELRISIQRLEEPSSVSYTTLEDILAVTHYPHELLSLAEVQLTTKCISLLREYTERNNVSRLESNLVSSN